MVNLFLWLFLSLFFLLSPLGSLSAPPRPPPLCYPHESAALLKFKNSFSVTNESSYFSYCTSVSGISKQNSTLSWGNAGDCCAWSGVSCDQVTGHVIGLHLECSGLEGVLHPNSSLFLLGHLQTLILSRESFEGSKISPQFGRFVSMIHLDLSYSGFSGQVPPELSYLSNLVTLDLSRNFDLKLETSILKRMIRNLTTLGELCLVFLNLSSVSPNSFVNLSMSLTSLDLSYTELAGEFPESIFRLPNLKQLNLATNRNLTGSFPKYNWTSPLKVLNLSRTGFLIDFSHLTKNLKFLNVLYLSSSIFVGSELTPSDNTTQITSLDLSFNNLAGEIPWSILNLKQLTELRLTGNKFTGQLPEICSSSMNNSVPCNSSRYGLLGPLPLNLRSFDLSNNLVNGTIPSWLYSLPSLRELDLSKNKFSGHISEFKYNSLTDLNLGYNKIHGDIPRSIFRQVNLSSLDLSSNDLTVPIDRFSELKVLEALLLSSNHLSFGSVNINSTLPNTLSALSLSSCNLSTFPYFLRSLENLIELDLSNNRIEGSVPQWLPDVGKFSLFFLNISHNFLTRMDRIPWKNLRYVDLQSNQLQGHLPIPQPSTILFLLSNNQLSGEIPPLICNLRRIGALDLSNNSLSGTIPPCTGSFGSLTVLDLRMNKFVGSIPSTFEKGNLLRALNLNGNQLEGSLPRSLLNCEKLEVLDVGNNKINGPFPQWLESLPELQVLILRSNGFYGEIDNPMVRFPFQKLKIMDLSDNEFRGLLPEIYFENLAAMMDAHTDQLEYIGKGGTIGSQSSYSVMVSIKGLYIELVKIQTMFIAIDFSRNNFTGEIPKSIGRLKSLKGLNFSENKLSGPLPALLANLTNLEWLDLSSNELVGRIHWQLVDLTQLQLLNLSRNKFEGPIPTGKQFNTFENSSYSGNPGLCGFPLSKSCSNDGAQHEGRDEEEHRDGIALDWKVVVMGYSSGVVIGISIGYTVLFTRRFDYWLMQRVGEGRLRKRNTSLRGPRRN